MLEYIIKNIEYDELKNELEKRELDIQKRKSVLDKRFKELCKKLGLQYGGFSVNTEKSLLLLYIVYYKEDFEKYPALRRSYCANDITPQILKSLEQEIGELVKIDAGQSDYYPKLILQFKITSDKEED